VPLSSWPVTKFAALSTVMRVLVLAP